MTFYVRKFPGPCDPRTPCMGGEKLNGFLTPPALIYIPEQSIINPVSLWTYDGPKGGLQAMPDVTLPFITAADVPRFVVWEVAIVISLGGNDFDLVVTIEKKAPTIPLIGGQDVYWTSLRLDGLLSDQEIASLPSSNTEYTVYGPELGGLEWTWNSSGLPTQHVTHTNFWPMAWDAVLPGPPFVNP